MNQSESSSLTDILITAAEELDWSCALEEYANGNYLRLGKYSPAGEDFSISVSVDTIAEEVRAAADTFDVDEHVFTWLEAGRHGFSGVPSARTLVDDAEQIETMLKELADALDKAQKDYERSSLAGKVADAVFRSTVPFPAGESQQKGPER